MSDLADLLSQKNLPQEPKAFRIVRQFVTDNFNVQPRLQLRDGNIIIGMPGSAAAGALRFRLHELQDLVGHDTKLVIVAI